MCSMGEALFSYASTVRHPEPVVFPAAETKSTTFRAFSMREMSIRVRCQTPRLASDHDLHDAPLDSPFATP